jgi:hypothetical protein
VNPSAQDEKNWDTHCWSLARNNGTMLAVVGVLLGLVVDLVDVTFWVV